jgi:site-specific DNA-methyltransferase (adenine-specific)
LFPDSNGSGGSVPNVKITGYGDGIGTGKAEYFGGERTKVNSGKGSAARFFYCAKANKHDRDEGCEELDAKSITNAKGNGLGRVCNVCSASILKPCECKNNSWILPATNKNNHPTVKPTALMMYLIKLITPIGGTVLDPFNGSGSTGKAAILQQYNYIGIDLSPEYINISKARIDAAIKDKDKDKQSKDKEADIKDKEEAEDTMFLFDNV